MDTERLQNILQNLEICTLSDREEKIGGSLDYIDTVLESLQSEIKDHKILTSSLSQIFGILCTIIAEFPPYRFETAADPVTKKVLRPSLIEMFNKRRDYAIDVLLSVFNQPIFSFLGDNFKVIERNIKSNAEPRRFMPFRVIQIGKLADILFELSLSLDKESDIKLLRQIHSFKYPRFGTSGWRARWKIDCNERTAKCVAQAICDFIKGNNIPDFVANAIPGASGRSDKILLIGYDSRANARRVAEWVADIAKQNKIKVHFATRDTPTPALVYWATEAIGESGMAGIVNCTASHNPPEWQGIKFSPFNGVPAPTAVTDFIAARANQLKLRSTKFLKTPRGYSKQLPEKQIVDLQDSYCTWLLSSRRNGIPIDPPALKRYFNGKSIIIDEMHGASRGYFREIMRRLNIRYSVIHGRKSQKDLEKLGYASPEWPYIAPLAEAVKKYHASLGVGFDTDGDRFGVISGSGKYITPNQILPLLTDYLLGRGFEGKIIRTVPDSRLTERIVGSWQIPLKYKPDLNVVPSYITHPFYMTIKGKEEIFRGLSIFLEPVGIKYVIEGMLIDTQYKVSYRPRFRETMLLGGEESSGLTSKGHIPDKDGIWGNLLVMNMLATKQATLEELWQQLCSVHGTAFFERLDVDAADFAKEQLVSHFFKDSSLDEFAGMEVLFIGGVEYDMVEIQLYDQASKTNVYLEIRASGTEPLNRIYVEAIGNPSSDEKKNESFVRKVQKEVLSLLETYSIREITNSSTPQELAAILAVTSPEQQRVRKAVARIFSSTSMQENTLKCLAKILDHLEIRNRPTCKQWIDLYVDSSG